MAPSEFAEARRVLIYRLGHLGDTVVALPALHLVARAFPRAERFVLTNLPEGHKAPPVKAVLGPSGLVHGYLEYPRAVRDVRRVVAVLQAIRRWSADVLVYLAEPRGRIKVLRDALFFRACGIRTLVGVPYSRDRRENAWLPALQCYESEASRLVRCLDVLGEARLEEPSTWDLHLTFEEEVQAERLLQKWAGAARFVACSVGAKVDVKDWGVDNWHRLLQELSAMFPGCGLVLFGAQDETGKSDEASRDWHGPVLNLCGRLTPRESAAVLKRASAFLGHDGGPMHLAACVGVPCVAIFSARAKPGVWFPYGPQHAVIYHRTSCYGCGLESCARYDKACVRSITVSEVLAAARPLMAARLERVALQPQREPEREPLDEACRSQGPDPLR